MKGKTHVAIRRERTIAHLDPTDPLHADDHAAAVAARLREQDYEAGRVDCAALGDLKYPSLRRGLIFDAGGGELASDAHRRLLTDIAQARGHYLSESTRKDGRTRLRKRKTTPLHALAVLCRPDHAAALAAIEQHPELRHLIKPFLWQVFRVVATEFTAATGLEVIAGQVHPEEGVLHLHLTYASVSANNELLWRRGHRGRHGLRLLGPSHCGTLRLVTAGFLPASEGSLALHDFKSRCRDIGGEMPVDWRLSLVVDGLFEHFAEHHGLQNLFSAESERYRAGLAKRRAERPTALKAAKMKAEQERDSLAAEVAKLKCQLAQSSAKDPVLQPRFAQPAALPPLPAISLQLDVRQRGLSR